MNAVIEISDMQMYVGAFLGFVVCIIGTLNIHWVGLLGDVSVHPIAMFCYKHSIEAIFSCTLIIGFLYAEWYLAFIPVLILFVLSLLRDSVIAQQL